MNSCRVLASKTQVLFYDICSHLPVENHSFLFLSFFTQSSDRLNRMNQAAKFFLQQILESRSWAGMVHFHSWATVKSELIQINSDVERNQLLETLPTSAGGGTSICSGIRTAFQVKIPLHVLQLVTVLLLGQSEVLLSLLVS